MSYGEPTTFNGDVTGSGHSPITLTMAPSGVAAGTYGGSGAIPVITVDAKGRVTNVGTAVPTNTPSLSQAFVVAVADASLPNARPLVAGAGIDIVDNGPSGLVVSRGRVAYLQNPVYYEPFWTGNNSYYRSNNNGANASIGQAQGTAQYPGGLVLTVRKSGERVWYACSPTMLRFGGGFGVEFETTVNTNLLTTSTERYVFRVGFLDNATADAIDGVYFEYDWTASNNWRLCTANNSTQTKVNSSVPVAINTDFTLNFKVAADGSFVQFFINGILAGTITTNIPTALGRETGLAMQLLKTAGGNNFINVDLYYMFFQSGV